MTKKGFTLVEVMIVAAIIGLISTIATPNFIKARARAQEVVCFKDRKTLESLDSLFYLDEGRHTEKLEELVRSAYLKKLPACPSRGTWSWTSDNPEDSDYKMTLQCSVHGVVLTIGTNTKATINGADYIGASKGWTKIGTDIVTYWNKQWVDYKFNFEEGGEKYKLSITAKNHVNESGWKLPPGYKEFLVAVYIDGKKKGVIAIPARDDDYDTGDMEIEMPGKGVHKVGLAWLNDSYYRKRRQDANIRISNVSIEKIE